MKFLLEIKQKFEDSEKVIESMLHELLVAALDEDIKLTIIKEEEESIDILMLISL